MALAVVQVRHDGTQGHVTLQSDNPNGSLAIQELQHGSSRQKAIEAAAKEGLADPRTGMTPSAYAVDKDGKTVGDPRTQKVAAYRIDIPVTRRLA